MSRISKVEFKVIKVCHLISSCITHHGPSNVLTPIVSLLDKSQYKFSIISLYAPPFDRNPSLIFRKVGADFFVLKMGSFLDLLILFKLVKLLREIKPDILHCHLVRANIYGRIAAYLVGIPIVINTHHGIENYMIGSGIADRVVRYFEYFSDKLVSYHIAVSDIVRITAIKKLRISTGKIFSIHNGVDIILYNSMRNDREILRANLGLNINSIVIGSVGILNKTKNHKLLILVANAIIKIHPSVQFIIFGEGEERVELENMVIKLGLTESVFFPGFTPNIPHVLQVLDIFALTSRSEGFGLAVAEAMASGLPCVAFDVGALSELIIDGKSGFLVQDDDLVSFANVLSQLINSSSLRSRLGLAARDRANEYFSINFMIKRYDQFYKNCFHDSLLNNI